MMTELEDRIAIAAIEAGERDGESLTDYIAERVALGEGEKDIWPVLLKLVKMLILDVWATGAINRLADPTSPRRTIRSNHRGGLSGGCS